MTADSSAATTPIPGVVAVVGSANFDFVVPVPRHPRLGETVIGGDHLLVPGGKGANQAVAARRLGAQTSFTGRLGDDDLGTRLREALTAEELDLTALHTDKAAPTGIALISVGPDGDNTIVVSPGANSRVSGEDIRRAGDALASADAVLAQLEVPVVAIEEAAAATNGRFVLNPAPATELPASLLERVDVLVPNRGELASLAGATAEPDQLDEVAQLANRLPGPAVVVVTLGADGALVVDTDVTHVPALDVRAIDTTAAGDAFSAALTVRLVAGDDVVAAARYAVVAAGLATTKRGAQSSLPSASEVADVRVAGA